MIFCQYDMKFFYYNTGLLQVLDFLLTAASASAAASAFAARA